MPAVVAIADRGTTFSGVIISSQGHIASAGHAVEPGEKYRVIFNNGRILPATGLGSNDRIDCAVLKLDNAFNMPHVELANSALVVKDQPCLSISHPGIFDAPRGPVLRFGYILRPISDNQGMIQSTALMEPGDSGGGLFDLNGDLIGVHSNIGESLSRNFDVPANVYRDYWKQLTTPKTFKIEGIPSIPKLGFDVERVDRRAGLRVTRLTEGGIARAAGLKVGDVISTAGGRRVSSIRRFRKSVANELESAGSALKVEITRDGKPQEILIADESLRTSRTPVSELRTSVAQPPRPLPELKKLTSLYAELETRLESNCVEVTSEIGGKEENVLGTLIANSNKMISKSSRVGVRPFVMMDEQKVDLRVIARDRQTDLIVMALPTLNKNGVNLFEPEQLLPSMGRFLISPDPEGRGYVSVWGTRLFPCKKRETKGFLGARMEDTDDGVGVVVLQVVSGGARNAGLRPGDVITRMDGRSINSMSAMLKFLHNSDPNRTVDVTLIRDDATIKKEITLGAKPPTVDHVAERMKKSGRRDGFPLVLSHDATVRPSECGGPLYDLQGNFIGINIARGSRSRCYAVPKSMIVTVYAPFANQ